MRILIVEDNRLLQTRIKESLLELDNETVIDQALNCKEAMNMFLTLKPETVILDLELPDGSGINLLRSFKKDNSFVNVIVFTNYATNEFRKTCMDLTAMDFIDKSDFMRLINTVKSLKLSRI